MKSKQTIGTLIAANGLILLTLFILFGLSYLFAAMAQSSGNENLLESNGVSTVVMAGLSALMLFFYASYTKKEYFAVLAFALFFGSIIEYNNRFFLIDGDISSIFLGFYLIMLITLIFTMSAAFSYNEVIRVNMKVMVWSILAILLFFTILNYFVFKEAVVFRDSSLMVFELIMLATVPVLGGWYYHTFFTKKNVMNLSVYYTSLLYFAAVFTESAAVELSDSRLLFVADRLMLFTYSTFLVFVPVAFYRIIKEKDALILKTNELKQNLFMFFKSAEYNENITVFVNSKYEILYANAKYKQFFNHYRKYLDSYLSGYIREKYEVIKYNMNYSASMKLEMEGKQYILDVDVVYLEQDTEEIFCITAKDITVIRAMQESLERSEYKYRSFFNLIPDFIFLYDIGKNRVIEANDMVYNDFKNIPNNRFVRNPMEERFMGLSYRELSDIGNKIQYGEILKLDILKVKDQKGQDVYVEPNFRLISVEKDKWQMLVFLRNVTNSVKLHELRIENEANIRKLYIAAENEKMFNEFFANMSHELRTPINVILSALDMMEISGFDGEKVEKYAGLIRHNSYRLQRIVSNILDITKVDSGFYKLNMHNYDIVSFTEDTVMSILHYAENKGLKIIFDTEVEEHIVQFDLPSMERVLLNLLSNAIKFTKDGGTIFVNLSMDEEAGKIFIDVKDTGIGIAPENVDTIFDRFIQVNKSTTRDNEGTGIGLSIVKKLMNLMGGDCVVESQLHVGTTFRLILSDVRVPGEADSGSIIDFYEKTTNRVDIEFSDLQTSDR
ncbi:sensor histidine kinase [Proteiniclasticum ruminis]|uniref:sensor histidine kinase n=1 Tax=Proteiniclasticum ruminis TaxID=398199 RepID=UPI00289C84CE|nr:HAMP domain-containing sensor histidine kinase [Proteiniclasticum ruminis]